MIFPLFKNNNYLFFLFRSSFFDSMQIFRLRWNSLNERCKKLEECLHEAKIEKEQLQAKLTLSRDYAQRIEKEKEELAIFVKQLHKDLEKNSILKWIETLGQKISTLNESTQIIPRVIDDITIISSDDENEDNSGSVSLAFDQVTHENSRKDSHGTVQSSPNSTTTDVTDHDYSFANSTSLPNQRTVSADCEVSVVDTIVSIENSPQRDSCDDPAFASNETHDARSDISDVNAPSSSQNSPSIVPLVDNIERCAVIEEKTTDGDLIPGSGMPSSPEYTLHVQSDNEETSSSTEKEQYLDASHNSSVDAQKLSESSPQCISSTKDQIFPRNEFISRSNVEVSEITTIPSPKMLHQFNVEKSTSPTNDYKNNDHSQNSEIDTNLSDPPQLIPIADIEKSINEEHNTDSGSKSATSPPTLTESSPRCEISNGNGIDFQVSPSDTVSTPYRRHLQFTSESLAIQGVSHEEICPAEEAPLTNVPDAETSEESKDTGIFEITNHEDESMNGDKSINGDKNNQATPEELMSQIFGSPMTSPDRESDVVCIPNEPNCMIDLNLSDDELFPDTGKQSASIVQPELTVNLPRIFAPGFKVTEESVNNLISRLEK